MWYLLRAGWHSATYRRDLLPELISLHRTHMEKIATNQLIYSTSSDVLLCHRPGTVTGRCIHMKDPGDPIR